MATKQLLVLGCSDTKRLTPGLLPAIERYDGSPYRVLRSYLRAHGWPKNLSIAILSAEFGLVGGFTRIPTYNKRMTKKLANDWAGPCGDQLASWAENHDSVHLSLGEDYLPALQPMVDQRLKHKTELFKGPIGMKLSQIKGLLEQTSTPLRQQPERPQPGSGQVTYFLPDWDDLLDPDFDFDKDSFSGETRGVRNDKHCCVLMQPETMCDGVLVSLAQHISSKGPLRRILGNDSGSLAPVDLRERFGLTESQSLFGDCGAFSYVNEAEPSISVEQAVALYQLHGFDFGASVDHIPVLHITSGSTKKELTEGERIERVRVTKENAGLFLSEAKRRKATFTPVGTIQALSPSAYAATVRLYYEMGYRHLAIGGLVPLQDSQVEAIVVAVMAEVAKLKSRPWIHLFGVFRPKLQTKFRELNVDSFDSATYFRKAWLRSDQNYLACDGRWFAAVRVPMTSDGRTRKRLEDSDVDYSVIEAQESQVLQLLSKYQRYQCQLEEVLDAVLDYDARLTRSSDSSSLRTKYRDTLRERPWTTCSCPFCQSLGIHIAIFRGSNRNKRRGAHNTLMLYKLLR